MPASLPATTLSCITVKPLHSQLLLTNTLPSCVCRSPGLSLVASLSDAPKPALQGHESVIVVVMEFCDLGSVLRAVTKKAFRPHGKWTYHTTYVSAAYCLAASCTASVAGPLRSNSGCACSKLSGFTCTSVDAQPGALFCRGQRCR